MAEPITAEGNLIILRFKDKEFFSKGDAERMYEGIVEQANANGIVLLPLYVEIAAVVNNVAPQTTNEFKLVDFNGDVVEKGTFDGSQT